MRFLPASRWGIIAIHASDLLLPTSPCRYAENSHETDMHPSRPIQCQRLPRLGCHQLLHEADLNGRIVELLYRDNGILKGKLSVLILIPCGHDDEIRQTDHQIHYRTGRPPMPIYPIVHKITPCILFEMVRPAGVFTSQPISSPSC